MRLETTNVVSAFSAPADKCYKQGTHDICADRKIKKFIFTHLIACSLVRPPDLCPDIRSKEEQ